MFRADVLAAQQRFAPGEQTLRQLNDDPQNAAARENLITCLRERIIRRGAGDLHDAPAERGKTAAAVWPMRANALRRQAQAQVKRR
ncbi:hypothetical protein LAD77_00215 [Klebsiella pneumoniae]|nr:hypothetical protein [Klebsiella pneumoniae]